MGEEKHGTSKADALDQWDLIQIFTYISHIRVADRTVAHVPMAHVD